jgi:threonine dehydrogenase-like Zn-dependent dehydrogenase
MPRKIMTTDGSTFFFREYELGPLRPDEVRLRVEFAAPKHGTESKVLTGSVFGQKRWDPELRMFLPRDEVEPAPDAPAERPIGNIVVGTVTAVGAQVREFQPGQRVFGYGPICEEHTVPASRCYSADGLSDADAVAVDPAHVAFVAVRDGTIRIGDFVAVYGLGAIGLCAVQIARAAGARRVFAVDPIAIRREWALAHGADAAFDPRVVDAALEIKLATDKKGVDVALETSGVDRALHDAIRCIRQCGTVVHVPWGPKSSPNLHLDEEFHHNRPTLIGSQAWAGWGNPDRSFPLWDHERAYRAAIDLFRTGLITGEGLVHPIVSFEEAPEALRAIFTSPETTIKVGVRL